MELSYWLSRWNKNKIGFHMPDGYSPLAQHLKSLKPKKFKNVLVPLCGKSLDMIELSKHFDQVIGVEISEKAIREFLEENDLQASEHTFAKFKVFTTDSITLWCGDFQKLPVEKIPPLDLIYDKAALVALPPQKRPDYARKLIAFCSQETQILLHHFIYNQNEMPGPPFSVSESELNNYFGEKFKPELLEQNQIDLSRFDKFKRRGLKSGLREQFLLFKPKN